MNIYLYFVISKYISFQNNMRFSNILFFMVVDILLQKSEQISSKSNLCVREFIILFSTTSIFHDLKARHSIIIHVKKLLLSYSNATPGMVFLILKTFVAILKISKKNIQKELYFLKIIANCLNVVKKKYFLL